MYNSLYVQNFLAYENAVQRRLVSCDIELITCTSLFGWQKTLPYRILNIFWDVVASPTIEISIL